MNPRPDPPPAVRWITRTLEGAGYDTWAVGGAVRDALLGRPSGDWDLATRADPGEVRRLFRRTVPIGIEHGTVGILARDGDLYEITTFRKDVETDGRHAVVAFADRVEDDLARRDFTVNAIAWHALREEFLDPFDGAGDLRRGVLRTVGEPEDRFSEDYLRILRALRFAGRFGLAIDPPSWTAAQDLVGHLTKLSPERIREELFKVLGSDPRPSRTLSLYAESGALATLYPELASWRIEHASVWTRRLAAVDSLPTGRPELRLAALLKGLDQADVAAILLRLRLSNRQTDEIAHLAAARPLPEPTAAAEEYRRWLSRHGPQRLHALSRLELAAARTGEGNADAVVCSWQEAKAIVRRGPPLTVGDLALDGRDLIGMGLKPGPHFGDILDELLDWVLEEPSRNDRGALEARAAELVDGPERDGGAHGR